jgi:hypothetical protein
VAGALLTQVLPEKSGHSLDAVTVSHTESATQTAPQLPAEASVKIPAESAA